MWQTIRENMQLEGHKVAECILGPIHVLKRTHEVLISVLFPILWWFKVQNIAHIIQASLDSPNIFNPNINAPGTNRFGLTKSDCTLLADLGYHEKSWKTVSITISIFHDKSWSIRMWKIQTRDVNYCLFFHVYFLDMFILRVFPRMRCFKDISFTRMIVKGRLPPESILNSMKKCKMLEALANAFMVKT